MLHDVIVVGSGPAGATAAATLAAQGKSVLLVDRQEFPRDKICGDGMPVSVTRMLTEHLQINLHNIPHYRITGINITAPSGNSMVVRQSDKHDYSLTARRYDFDFVLHQHAVRKGAKFEVMDIEAPLIGRDGRVIGVIERRGHKLIEHETQVVIGADGASSAIARGLQGRVAKREETAIAIRAYGTTAKPPERCLYMMFQPDLLPGYGWVFPLANNGVNVGVGIIDQTAHEKHKKLSVLLDHFLDEIRPDFPIELDRTTIRTWPIPCWISDETRVVRGAYLIGDAGRNADALTGGGIYPAMLTGLLAAESAAKVLTGTSVDEAARLFDRRSAELLNRSLRKSLYVQRLITSHPIVFNGLMRMVNMIPPMRAAVLYSLAGQHT